MKRVLALLSLILFFALINQGSSLTTNLKENYSPKETIIGKFSGGIFNSISNENVRFYRENHIEIGTEYGIKKLDGDYYIWAIAPEVAGNYSFVVEDVLTFSDGAYQIIDFEEEFDVYGEQVDYFIKPGLIYTSEDFSVEAVSYAEEIKTVSVNFPESREIDLFPGINEIEFLTGDVVGNYFEFVEIGFYSVPVFVLGVESICGDGKITGDEICDIGEDGTVSSDDNLDEKDCSDFGNFTSGDLMCGGNCMIFNTSNCVFDVNESEAAENESENETGTEPNGAELVKNESEEIENENEFYFVDFKFGKTAIKTTILNGSEFPQNFSFNLTNIGNVTIEVLFDYDDVYFSLIPDSLLIEPNETKAVKILFRRFDNESFRDVIVGFVGEKKRYLLFVAEKTSDEENVKTEEFEDEESLYRCSELDGTVCTGNEICGGQVVSALDNSNCCLGTCEVKEEGGNTWIGYLILGIVILVSLIIYLKYKKTRAKKSPLEKATGKTRNIP